MIVNLKTIDTILKNQIVLDYEDNLSFLKTICYQKQKEYNDKSKTIFIISGGIAAGKSTLCYNVVKTIGLYNLPFVGTDVFYERYFKNLSSFEEDYNKARKFTDDVLNELVKEGTSFVWETVFSKEKKMQMLSSIEDAGYKIIVFYVGVDLDIAIERSNRREEKGGNDVDEMFIKDRFHKSNQSLRHLSQLPFDLYVFDNKKELGLVYAHNGSEYYLSNSLPAWAKEVFNDD